eukprot:11477453-Alexandrium_andersonii.AAC.1
MHSNLESGQLHTRQSFEGNVSSCPKVRPEGGGTLPGHGHQVTKRRSRLRAIVGKHRVTAEHRCATVPTLES